MQFFADKIYQIRQFYWLSVGNIEGGTGVTVLLFPGGISGNINVGWGGAILY